MTTAMANWVTRLGSERVQSRLVVLNYNNHFALAKIGMNTWDNKYGLAELLAEISVALKERYAET